MPRRCDTGLILNVYLDQKDWIDLGKAAHSRPGGERFVDSLVAARAAVDGGAARFPLSLAHYIETWRQADDAKRRRLAETMTELSRHVTIASPPALCNNELNAFLGRRFRRPPARTPLPVFAHGLAHANGMPAEALDLEAEHERLAIRPNDFLDPGLPGRGKLDYANAYAEAERSVAEGVGQHGIEPEAYLAATAVMEIWENIQLAMVRANLAPQALFPISLARPDLPSNVVPTVLPALLDVAREFIAELPTRDAALRLRMMRHQNRAATQWEPNDLNDIAYLACAVVHCDVVVTEKQWVHELRRSGLLADHATVAIRNVRELPDALAEAAASAPTQTRGTRGRA